MVRFSALAVLLLFAVTPAAQAQEITKQPLCFELENQTGFRIYTSVESSQVANDTESASYHRNNIYLQDKEVRQICSRGPFFSGRSLKVSVRTVFPIFQCYFPAQGRMTIKAARDADNEMIYSANCQNIIKQGVR